MNVTKRNRSFADLTLGPSQSAEINKEPGVKGNPKGAQAGSKKSQSGGPSNYWLYFFGLLFAALGAAYLVHRPWFDAFVELAWECATFQRLPATAQDNFAAMMWSLFALPVIMVLDICLCYPLSKSHVARWYFIHAGTNAIITVLALPDIYYTLAAPGRGLSVRYCESLPFPACSDLPTCFIVGLHLYHVLFFKLTKDDVFHHLLFVPVVCFAHFAFPCGSAANILCFFISGFPGGIDYFLLGLVKNKLMHPLKEKRLNCSINTWIRAPGITISCVFFWVGFMSMDEQDMEHQRVFPAIVLWIIMALIFYNGQFYAQRVVGNYYIWKAEGAVKAGKRATLHPS